ncbi:MAG: hypothetical protein E6J88_03015 [Deltaproteobacteria bacterium]|nr:MAG: hypothetical protein E6J88_03015 [Deltaproteobacteria bacterium]
MKRKLFFVPALAAAGCAHGIRNVEDCGQVQAVDRKLECGVCTGQNKAGGLLGTYEYRESNADGQRCVRVQ